MKRFRRNLNPAAKNQNRGSESEADLCKTPVFTSTTAKKRAKDKVTATLPQSPRKRAEIIATLASSSPRTRRLEKRGLLKSPKEQRDTQAMRSLIEDFAEGLSHVKRTKTVDERAAYAATRSIAFGKSVKANRQQSTCCSPRWRQAKKSQ